MKLLVLFSLIPWFIGDLYAHDQRVDYHTIKEHLIKTYSRNKLSEYSKRDYIVTADNFLIDPQLRILARQAYRDNQHAIQTLQEVRTAFQIKLHTAKKEAEDKHNTNRLLNNLSPLCLGIASGISGLRSAALLISEPRDFLTGSIFATISITSFLVGIFLPFHAPEEKNLYIATGSLMKYIREIEKIQRDCLLKKEKTHLYDR